jgi:hypothetical protein
VFSVQTIGACDYHGIHQVVFDKCLGTG